MAVEPTDLSERERRLDEILASYFEAAESGRAPAPEDLLKRFPDLAPELTDFFLDENLFNRLSEPLQQSGPKASHGTGMSTLGPERASEPTLPPEAAELRSFGDYQLLHEIGRGGMGVVYKARQRSLNRLVALKMVRTSQWGEEAEIARFRHEAEAAALLDHPHMVPIYEVGEQDGHHYFSMKLIEGGNLAARLGSGPWAVDSTGIQRRAARLLATVARAVHYAHQHGIIHRDLKPANILLDEQEQPHVTDFGLAKRVEGGGTGTTLSGTIVGTPSYMAPEQAAGKRRVTTAADVYSLGAILYELLTGRPPFRSELPLETLRQVLEVEPERLRTLNPALDGDLETVCLKCLEKDPERRYGSAEALAEDLERWQAGDSIRARPVGNVERVQRWCRRNRAVAALIASVASLLVLIAAGSLVAVLLFRSERDRALRAEQDARHNEQAALNRFWALNLAQARERCISGQVGQRFGGLEAVADAARIRTALELRNVAIACLTLPDLRIPKEWRLESPWLRIPTADAGLRRYAVADAEGNISVRAIADNQEIVRLHGFGVISAFHDFSPDGRLLRVLYHRDYDRRFVVWDLSRPKMILETKIGLFDLISDFSPDSRWVAVCRKAERMIQFFDLTNPGREQRGPKADLAYDGGIHFHPDGRSVAVTTQDPLGVQLFEITSGKLIATFAHPAKVHGVAWRRDGRLMATACADRNVYLWDPANSQKPTTTLIGHQGEVVGVTFNHRGDRLVSHSWDASARLWDLATGGKPLSTPFSSHQYHFSPDDRLLGFGRDGSRIWLWEVARGDECWTFPNQLVDRRFFSIAISSDGQVMAAAGDAGVKLWDLTCGAVIAIWGGGPCYSVSFDPRDNSLLICASQAWARRQSVFMRDLGGHVTIPQIVNLGVRDLTRAGPSPDAQTLVVFHRAACPSVWDLETQRQKFSLVGQPGIDGVSFSRDGKWMASGTWLGRGVRVWDAKTGKAEHDLPMSEGTAWAAFSPDSRWLVTSTGQEFRSWEVGSWQPGPLRLARGATDDLPGSAVFTPDGKMLAVGFSRTSTRLIDPVSGQEFATLPTTGGPFCFSPDGSLLVTLGENDNIQVWNIRRVREQLAAMNLDWDAALQPEVVRSAKAPALKIKVIVGN